MQNAVRFFCWYRAFHLFLQRQDMTWEPTRTLPDLSPDRDLADLHRKGLGESDLREDSLEPGTPTKRIKSRIPG